MVCLYWRGEKIHSINFFCGGCFIARGNDNKPSVTVNRCTYCYFVLSRCDRNIQLGVSAIVCYLHACRHQNEAKCRKYLARTIWLMTYDDEKV